MSYFLRAAALAGGLVLAGSAGAFAQTTYPPQPAASAWPAPPGGVYGPNAAAPAYPRIGEPITAFGRRFPPTPWYLALRSIEGSLAPQQHEQVRQTLEQFHAQYHGDRAPGRKAAERAMHSQIESMLNPGQMAQFQSQLAQFRADRRSHTGPYAGHYGGAYPNRAYPPNGAYPNGQYPNGTYPNGPYPNAPTPIPNRPNS